MTKDNEAHRNDAYRITVDVEGNADFARMIQILADHRVTFAVDAHPTGPAIRPAQPRQAREVSAPQVSAPNVIPKLTAPIAVSANDIPETAALPEPSDPPPSAKRLFPSQQAALDVAPKDREFTAADMCPLLPQYQRNSISTSLSQLENAGYLERVGHGVYRVSGQGKTAVAPARKRETKPVAQWRSAKLLFAIAPRDRPFRSADLLAPFMAAGFSRNSLGSLLGLIEEEGGLIRVSQGVYRFPEAQASPPEPAEPATPVPDAPAPATPPAATSGPETHHPLAKAILTMAQRRPNFALRHAEAVAHKHGYSAALIVPLLHRLVREGSIAHTPSGRWRVTAAPQTVPEPQADTEPSPAPAPPFAAEPTVHSVFAPPPPPPAPAPPSWERPSPQTQEVFLSGTKGLATFTIENVRPPMVKAGYSRQTIAVVFHQLKQMGVIEATGEATSPLQYRVVTNGADHALA